ncbi:MAG: PaaI family thioesterase [Pseudomonadales bacterium]|jgi:acyl-CoA thioesterase
MSEAPTLPHPFGDLVGFRVESRGEGASHLALEVGPQHFNPHGLVHGAVLYALADTGMGGALSSTLKEGQLCTTIEIKINYFRPWKSGTLTCLSRVIHQGRTTAALVSDLYDGEERHLAQATGTFAIVSPRGA